MTICRYCILAISLILTAGCLSETSSLEPDWIVDSANVLDTQEEANLINRLSNFYDSTSVAIVGITLASVDNQRVESYAQSLYQSWEIGNPETHNGIVVLLLIEDRLVHIEAGSGMAPEVITSQALDSIQISMADIFATGDYYRGFQTGFELLMRHADTVPWEIAYTSLHEVEHDSVRSKNQIVSTDAMIIGFDEDQVLVQDSDGRQARLIVPVNTPVLSTEDVIGFSGRIVESDSLVIRVLNLEVDFAF